MDYRPVTSVWEITMGCNMRCKHCGSSCENAQEDELTTEEALKLCDDLGKLGFEWITLSGGEPTTRKDWDMIARRLGQNGIIPNMITNGWLVDDKILDRAREAGINTIAVSVDGLCDTHDFIRKPGSFERIMKAFDLMRQKDLNFAAITTVNRKNIGELAALRELLIAKGVKSWQLQIGLPMGNMADHGEMIMEPRHVNDIIDFAYEAMQKGGIDIQLADCIGYYNVKEIEVRKSSLNIGQYIWQGCAAGKYGMGILHNGDIIGCTSVRDKQYVEGNVRLTPVKEIWDNPQSFSWNRGLKKSDLQGLCSKCQYGQSCLGGCSNTRITMEGSLYAENKYCSYNFAVSKAEDQLKKIDSPELLKSKADKFLSANNFQLAEILLSKAVELDGGDMELLSVYGYVCFMLGNYGAAEKANRDVLRNRPNDSYAYKGLGLTLCRMGSLEDGLACLRKSIDLADENFFDPYFDLCMILVENGRNDEAFEVVEAARRKSPDFEERSRQLHERIKLMSEAAAS